MTDALKLPTQPTDASSRNVRQLFRGAPGPQTEREGIDLRASLSVLWRRKVIIVG